MALAIGLPAIVALMLVTTASRLTRLRLRRSSLATVTADDIPPPVRATLDKAAPLLTGLGFRFRYSTVSRRAVATEGDQHLITDVYEHEDGRTHALVTPSMTPEQGQPCSVMWVTLLQGGQVLATVNCYLHTMLGAPTGWSMHDDYLPGPQQAWERHQRLVQAAGDRVVRDGKEFFRVNKEATERLIPDLRDRGLVVRNGRDWQVPWRAALPFAWRLYLGQRRVARARSATGSAGAGASAIGATQAPVGVDADVEAFEHQLAVLRAARWTGRKKIRMFLLTGALFLGVGSLWISWTFLPILLAVIALHEGGHYLAMKLSGYRNLSVFFLPGLGGLATGEKASASPWEKLFVYLAGPMPGLVLAVGALIGQLTGNFLPPPWFQEFLFASLVINYLNLLPITPLDGGRVVETFLFARLPVARFLFALLGLAAFLALGLATGDKVVLVIAVFVALSLPHQWRIMRVDRAIVRRGAETLDEHGAIRRVFTALQQPAFAGWPFARRAAAATALLPELQGRRAGVVEAAGGLAIYLACLLAPPVAAVLAVPQLAGVAAAIRAGYNMVPDDVDEAPERPRVAEAQRDWDAEVARLPELPEAQRLPLLLDAAVAAAEGQEDDKRKALLKAAWEIAEQRPLQDLDRARTLMAMARDDAQPEQRQRWHRQVAAELDGLRDKPSLLLLAQAKQDLAADEQTTPAARVALLQQVVAHRQEALAEGEPELLMARLLLAQALDAEGVPGDAEALLRRNVDGLTLPAAGDRSREALQRRIRRVEQQVELAWFLNAHGQPRDATTVLEAAQAGVPTRVSVSWEHPNRELQQAALWVALHLGQADAVKAGWRRYEDSRQGIPRTNPPAVGHEIDRLVVAQATADDATKALALEAIAQGMKGQQGRFVRARFCEQSEPAGRWRMKQRQARVQAAKAAGVCA
jgi:Zn-dependent protease